MANACAISAQDPVNGTAVSLQKMQTLFYNLDVHLFLALHHHLICSEDARNREFSGCNAFVIKAQIIGLDFTNSLKPHEVSDAGPVLAPGGCGEPLGRLTMGVLRHAFTASKP